jgi:hypothetical protein
MNIFSSGKAEWELAMQESSRLTHSCEFGIRERAEVGGLVAGFFRFILTWIVSLWIFFKFILAILFSSERNSNNLL